MPVAQALNAAQVTLSGWGLPALGLVWVSQHPQLLMVAVAAAFMYMMSVQVVGLTYLMTGERLFHEFVSEILVTEAFRWGLFRMLARTEAVFHKKFKESLFARPARPEGDVDLVDKKQQLTDASFVVLAAGIGWATGHLLVRFGPVYAFYMSDSVYEANPALVHDGEDIAVTGSFFACIHFCFNVTWCMLGAQAYVAPINRRWTAVLFALRYVYVLCAQAGNSVMAWLYVPLILLQYFFASAAWLAPPQTLDAGRSTQRSEAPLLNARMERPEEREAHNDDEVHAIETMEIESDGANPLLREREGVSTTPEPPEAT